MKFVDCGMFRLPGISFERGEVDDALLTEMIDWVDQSKCGMHMTDKLFSFKNSGQRDFFLLRWSDRLPKKEDQ